MPRLAIIIPAVRSIESLETTLVSVLENRPDDCEILVVLNQAYGDPYQLEGEVRFIASTPGDSAMRCINRGLDEATSEIVHVLASGCTIAQGWTDEPLEQFRDPRIAAVAPLVCNVARPERVLTAGVGYSAGGARRLYGGRTIRFVKRGLRPIHGACGLAAFYRKSALDALGGFPIDLGDTLADVDLAWSLRHIGYQTVVEPSSQVFAPAEMFQPQRGFRQAMYRERLFWRNAPAVGWPLALACHPLNMAMELLASIPRLAMVTQLLGRLCGALQIGRHLRHHAWLQSLDQNVVVLPVNAESQHRLDRPHPSSRAAKRSQAEQKRARA